MFNELLAAGNPADMFGVRITSSVNCLEETQDPVRKHEREDWMSDTYHKRIQKKWNKRFGFTMKPVMFQTPQGILCHPSLLPKIRAALSGSERQ